jgi:hypothetical protein
VRAGSEHSDRVIMLMSGLEMEEAIMVVQMREVKAQIKKPAQR